MNRLPATILLTTLLFAGGCAGMKPGNIAFVQPVSDKPRAGNVYLLRGWIGIFSTGIDQLTLKLNDQGVRSQQFQDDQWRSVANQIIKTYKGAKDPEPLVLVGHSYGADDVVHIARKLEADGVVVDLLITLDPVTPPEVPTNVKVAYNLFQSNGIFDVLPVLRGVALKPGKAFAGELRNVDIKKDRRDLLEDGTDHFKIEKKSRIHNAIMEEVLTHCLDREDWLALKRGPNQLVRHDVPAPAPDKATPTTKPVVAREDVPAHPSN